MMHDKAEELKDGRYLGGAWLAWGLALGFLGTAGAKLRAALPRAHHLAHHLAPRLHDWAICVWLLLSGWGLLAGHHQRHHNWCQ